MKKEEIKKLKDNLKLKEKVFELIRKEDSKSEKEVKEILNKNKEILSYFIKFKHLPDQDGHQDGKIILLTIGGWSINPNRYYDNEVLEDFERIKKEIAQKEYLIQQKEFLKAQEEFLKMQKEDIKENKKDREKLNNFTFILAVGVIATLIFYFMQTFIQFKLSQTIHIMGISGICLFLFLLIIFFVFHSFDMKDKLISFWNKTWVTILILIIFLIIIILLAFTIKDQPTKIIQNSEAYLISQTNQELQDTKNLINLSIKEQKEIGSKLDKIILKNSS